MNKEPSTSILRRAKEDKARLENHKHNLVKALETAPFYLISSHGIYDLRKPPVSWIVPPNTYIFETQTIGDMTSTSIDDPLWDFLLGRFRPAFIAYFLGNEDRIEYPDLDVIEMFRNLILYKPGDIIYTRELYFGGGTGLRKNFAFNGFFRFEADDQTLVPSPKPTTPRPLKQVEIAGLDSLRNTMIQDEDFFIANKDVVDLITTNKPIHYKGLYERSNPLIEPQDFSLPEPTKDETRVFFFSSCASVGCRPVVKRPPGMSNSNYATYFEQLRKNAYYSPKCTEHLRQIEVHQRNIMLELIEMGINTGPGGAGWTKTDTEINANLMPANSLTKKGINKSKNKEYDYSTRNYNEKYAAIDADLADWWKYVGENFKKTKRQKRTGGKITRPTQRSRKPTP